MKSMKKFASLLLALVMVFAMATTAFAANIDLGRNAITVNGVVANETYKLYKMLDLVVNDENTPTAYSYTVNSNWTDFFKSGGAGNEYVTIDTLGYVTWNTSKNNAADVQAFGQKAAAYAAEKNLTALQTITPKGFEKGIVFGNLDSGYYLITSTLGTQVIVLTTPKNPKPVVNEKNEEPTIEKKVQEESNNQYGDSNTAEIGQTVNFQTTIHAKKGAQNYVLHDEMSEGLTLDQNSIVVKVGNTTLTKGTDYTVAFNVKHNEGTDNESTCDFEITFTKSYLDSITTDADIVVTYSAVLNDEAVIYDSANTNKTQLKYGEKGSTEWDETKTHTFSFDIIKTNSDKKLLNGAEFELYDAEKNGNKIALVKESEGVYRVATSEEQKAPNFSSAVIEAGKVTVKGLDANTSYWLEETEAPAGYNKLKARVKVEIKETNVSTTFDATGTDPWEEADGGVQITNNTGTELPSTGGMGTTIFYVLGSVLVLGAAVLLITKKRMSVR